MPYKYPTPQSAVWEGNTHHHGESHTQKEKPDHYIYKAGNILLLTTVLTKIDNKLSKAHNSAPNPMALDENNASPGCQILIMVHTNAMPMPQPAE